VRRRVVLAVAGPIVLVLLVAQQLALRDLRELEASYIAAREPTACATQELVPFAFGNDDVDIDELDLALVELIEEAADEVRTQRRRFERARTLPFPPLRSARSALGNAYAAQGRLYEAMLADPQGSEPELRRLGRANARTERRMATARRWLVVDPPAEWNRRFVCDEEPPFVPPR
jgi:hypothetical protein